MAARRRSVLSSVSSEPTTPRADQDVFIDMQYAKHTCTDPTAFVTEPWKYCQNPTNTYLGLRFDQREKFKSMLNKSHLSRVEHEVERIEQTRVNFCSYDRKKQMMAELNDARREWKAEVKTKLNEYIENIRETPKYPEGWNRNQKLDLNHLERVNKAWKVEDNSQNSKLSPNLEPEYGLKAGAMYFHKSDSGYGPSTYYHSKFLPGKFPNQKLPVHNLLDDSDLNPLSEPCPADKLRYFHFPTNNMLWIEKAMARYYNEDDGDYTDLVAPDKMSKAEKLLCREFWRDPGSGAYMQRDATPKDTASTNSPQEPPIPRTKPKNFAIFLPYLHWETDSRRSKMAEVIKEETLEREKKSPIKKRTEIESKTRNLFFNALHSGASKSRRLEQQMTRFKKPEKSKLGRYLMGVAQVADEMDYEADERLLRENLHVDPPMHVRRTLDQSYFLTIDDTAVRDRDQVVYRETREGRSFYSMNTRVVMVDQLWLWILDDNTIITSFPRRWGRNKPDPSGVHKSLRVRLAHIPEGQIQSIYDLALIIIDQCSRVFFDRTKPLDQRPEVMDIFASAIGRVTERTTIAYESFWLNMQLRSLNPPPYGTENTDHRYPDINLEGTLLREVQDIAEELQIMLRIYNQQLHVVKDLRKALGHMNGESKNEPDEMRSLVKLMELWQNQNANNPGQISLIRKDVVPESTIEEANDLLELIKNRKSEIQDLEDAALKTGQRLQGLLSLKQQEASIIEAKAALQLAGESVRQGRAIMAFTVVTIFFLPLGFFAAFFGMNNQEINDAPWMTLGQQTKYMFGISAAVITISISMAFSPWTRAILTVLVKVPLAYITEYTGLRHFWMDHIIDHQTLGRKGQKRLDHIYKRQERIAARQKEEEDKKNEENAKRDPAAMLVETFLKGNVDGRTVTEMV
ncbi:uncharacterized protein BP5553_08584 [Venustampulla echinocandica]|uniref:Magnesium transport protein CorA, transmembrane region n=1 Tax=Venustampulla echinocandica TaxID=2656787 RepID=A0A370TEM9_9HELO|nr:uncharacterized protein BP5553_08584 [Venustampulla echinocandica]RDL33145.1 hypothetical protein BP5553_08584 [Venustampulla echinocandica]